MGSVARLAKIRNGAGHGTRVYSESSVKSGARKAGSGWFVETDPGS